MLLSVIIPAFNCEKSIKRTVDSIISSGLKDYEIVIGLEVHCELSTKTKIFCSCSTEFGGEPNTHCCPICMAMPGTLPVLNEKVVEYAVKAGLAAATVVERCEGVKYVLRTDYNGIGKIQYIIGNMGVYTLDTRYTENVEVEVVVPVSDEKSFIDQITESTAGRTGRDNMGNVQYIIIDGKCQVC